MVHSATRRGAGLGGGGEVDRDAESRVPRHGTRTLGEGASIAVLVQCKVTGGFKRGPRSLTCDSERGEMQTHTNNACLH